jgi:hypothetical protein
MIWIFGDSYSAEFDHKMMGPFADEYIKYKGYLPKTFGGFLSKHYDCSYKNLAIPGNNNDTIFEDVIKNAPSFQKDDIVIIGWSDIVRFRMAKNDKTREFRQILPRTGDPEKYLKDVSRETINEILVNRMSPAYYEEFKIRFNFINWLFRDMIHIQWTVHESNMSAMYITDVLNFLHSNLNTVKDDTAGKVVDLHYSEIGHRKLADNFIELINNKDLRDLNNSITTLTKSYKHFI